MRELAGKNILITGASQGLGRKEDALREGRRAVELMPVARDAINGAHMIEFFAIICAWTGEKDLAFEQLAIRHGFPAG
jgi:serine/threonine-protein kinase